MSVIVEFNLAADQFPLESAVTFDPALAVELASIVPLDGDLAPLLWVTVRAGEDPATLIDEFVGRLTDAEVVEDVCELDQFDRTALLEVSWSVPVGGVFTAISQSGGWLLSGRWRDGWHFQAQFEDHGGATAFYQAVADHDIDVDVRRVYVPHERIDDPTVDLTPKQLEALELALESGYFSTPRRVSLDDIAAELDISQQALSTRIRRGNERILRSVLGGG
jgi:hypothetical protein